jgi:hypothetical protein
VRAATYLSAAALYITEARAPEHDAHTGHAGRSLNGNRISGTLPTELGQLSPTWLALNANDLSGSVPTELASITSNCYLAQSQFGDQSTTRNVFNAPFDPLLSGASCVQGLTKLVYPGPSPPPTQDGAILELTGIAPKIHFGPEAAPICSLMLDSATSRIVSTCQLDTPTGRRLQDTNAFASLLAEHNALKAEVVELRRIVHEHFH